jgi:hypothetical protein
MKSSGEQVALWLELKWLTCANKRDYLVTSLLSKIAKALDQIM